jgi:pimeloyl-ACP methyl ester carboxylesterase
MSSGVPVQYFQSIIAAQLAVAGAVLFQVRFFDTSNAKSGAQVDPRLRLVLVVVIAATLFVSLEAMREGWGSAAAALVGGGLALSVLPILLRVLPPLTRDIETHKRDPHLWVTVFAGVDVSYEMTRAWCDRFGHQCANQLRRRGRRLGDKWHLDEVFVQINGAQLIFYFSDHILVELPHASHFIQEDAPARIAEAIIDRFG